MLVRGFKGIVLAPLLVILGLIAWQGLRTGLAGQGNPQLMVMPAVIVIGLMVVVSRSPRGWRLAFSSACAWTVGKMALLYAYFYAVATTGRL